MTSCIARTWGRSAIGTGSSSPTTPQSHAVLRSSALEPTDRKTVRRLTPAASATASIVVPAYPRVSKRARAASTMRRRVCRADSARAGERYVRDWLTGPPEKALTRGGYSLHPQCSES